MTVNAAASLGTTYKKLEELEDSFVGKYIKCIPTDRVNNWQSVDFIFDQRVYSIEEAAGKAIRVIRRLSRKIRKPLDHPSFTVFSLLLYYHNKRFKIVTAKLYMGALHSSAGVSQMQEGNMDLQ